MSVRHLSVSHSWSGGLLVSLGAALSVPIATACLVLAQSDLVSDGYGCAVLSLVAARVILSHESELLSFRRMVLLGYSLVAVAGWASLLLAPNLWHGAVRYAVLSGLGCVTTLLPGLMRALIGAAGALIRNMHRHELLHRGGLEPGGWEAAWLVIPQLPLYAQNLADAARFGLGGRRSVLRSAPHLVVALLYSVVEMMYMLAAAALNRCFRVAYNSARIQCSLAESATYLAAALTIALIAVRGAHV